MKGIQDLGLTPFFANIITEDWLTQDPNELLTKSLVALDAQKKGIILFHDILPQTAEILEAFLSELFARGYETVVFRPKLTLASTAANHGIRMGTFFFGTNADAKFKTAVREFNLYTVPAFFKLVLPNNENDFDFSIPDQTADAAPIGTKLRIHNSIWCSHLPDWLKNGRFTGEQLKAILERFINVTYRHYEEKYPGRIIELDVVNEPFSWHGDKCPWNRIGLEAGLDELEYVRISLRTARAVAPNAKLYINDFGGEGMGEKSDLMFQLVKDLIREGVPINGVGLQSHFMVETGGSFPQMPPVDEIAENMDRLHSLGLETMITEADFSLCTDKKICGSEVSEFALQRQACAYRNLVRACIRSKGCKAVTTWGVGDKDSWIPKDAGPSFIGWGAPLLFDWNWDPKPAFHALIRELLMERKSRG